MEKKQYIAPLSEVMQLGSDVIMEAFGPASMASDPFAAPKKRENPEVF